MSPPDFPKGSHLFTIHSSLFTKSEERTVKVMFIENRIRNEQIIEKNINEKSDGFSVVG